MYATGFSSDLLNSYYIHTLLSNGSKPLILVPATEVQALFDDIKKELHLLVYFPKKEKEPGFRLSFTEKGIPRPRYLGRLDLEHNLDEMEAKIPPYSHEHNGATRTDDRSFAAFKKKMEAAIEATKQKTKHQRDGKKKQRVGIKQGWCEQLKRAQCYFGVRPRVEPGMPNPMEDPSIPLRELEQAMRRYQISNCVELPNLLVSEPAPFAFQDNVIFICVDVEAYEKDNRPITEIGISALDTNDLIGVPPGECGSAWMKKIRARHFRIIETAHLHNTEFVSGCAERFEPEFGASEWIYFKDAPQVIASCFRPPYSRPVDGINNAEHRTAGVATANASMEKRQIVLVGHDVRNDIGYLRKIGYDVSTLSNIIEALDTADLYRAWKHHQNPTKLGSILLDLEIVGWNLHNAGNDAAYTLQALLGIAISSRNSPLTTSQSQLASRAQQLEREARDRAKEEAEEWAVADVEGGDGGPPKPLERFGWPQSSPPAGDKKSHGGNNGPMSKMISSEDLKAEIAATELCEDEKEGSGKIGATEDEEGKNSGGDEDGGTFSQSIEERLTFLEDEDGEVGGGVKLPVTREKEGAVGWW
ncbi:MAG: hypothetical protein Q9182_001091 [Xanthomendoza sp. 2 TL-2023]